MTKGFPSPSQEYSLFYPASCNHGFHTNEEDAAWRSERILSGYKTGCCYTNDTFHNLNVFLFIYIFLSFFFLSWPVLSCDSDPAPQWGFHKYHQACCWQVSCAIHT